MPQDLFSSKKMFDSVHGFVRFDEYEKILIDTLLFQRLHYIHQMGLAYLVYPGATHSRFEHSLGVTHIATLIFDRLCDSVRPDLFQYVPRKGSVEYSYWKKVLRIAALCHDLGHLPFSHVVEDDILQEGHEEETLKIMESSLLKPLWNMIEEKTTFHKILPDKCFKDDVIKIAIGEEKLKKLGRKSLKFSTWERIVAEIISGDYFGADRIDYLLRDSKYTGIAYGMFDYLQLIEQLRILPSEDGEGLSLGIDENGLESTEALLLARHFMHMRVYQYSPVKAFNFHMRRFLKDYILNNSDFLELPDFIYFSDPLVIVALTEAAKNEKHKFHRDAKIILERKDHFKALVIPEGIKEEDLIRLKKEHSIDNSDMSWEFCHPENLKPRPVSFLISRRYLKTQKLSGSSILANLPSEKKNWVYVAPEFELLLIHALEK